MSVVVEVVRVDARQGRRRKGWQEEVPDARCRTPIELVDTLAQALEKAHGIIPGLLIFI